MKEAVDQGIDLNELKPGETVHFSMPAVMAAGATGSQSVSITQGVYYYYADYGLGSYLTSPYYVSWGNITATAYCVQPSKPGPGDGTYTITKIEDNQALAKVCYYGTLASEENGFFDEKHPDFRQGSVLSLLTLRHLMLMDPVTGILEQMQQGVRWPWNCITIAWVCRISQM